MFQNKNCLICQVRNPAVLVEARQARGRRVEGRRRRQREEGHDRSGSVFTRFYLSLCVRFLSKNDVKLEIIVFLFLSCIYFLSINDVKSVIIILLFPSCVCFLNRNYVKLEIIFFLLLSFVT